MNSASAWPSDCATVRAAVAKFNAVDLGTLRTKDYTAFIVYCDERSGDDE